MQLASVTHGDLKLCNVTVSTVAVFVLLELEVISVMCVLGDSLAMLHNVESVGNVSTTGI